MDFQERNPHFMKANLLIERARGLAGTEEKPEEGTQRQLKGIERKLKREIEKTKQNRGVMTKAIVRMRCIAQFALS
jgi:hypothetical protein